MIARAEAALGAGVPVGIGDRVGLGVDSADALGSTIALGSTDGGAVEPSGSLDGDGSAEELAPGVALRVGVASAVPVEAGVAAGDALAAGVRREIGTTKIEPPVLDALDSTTAACSAWGSSTTDPGLLRNETTPMAPASIEAQWDEGAASWGQTDATLAMFIVYGPSAERLIQATSPGGTASGVAPAASVDSGPPD
jgi:hypothetical protein